MNAMERKEQALNALLGCRISKPHKHTSIKKLHGGGFLLTERAAAERAAAHSWELSTREREMQKLMAGGAK